MLVACSSEEVVDHLAAVEAHQAVAEEVMAMVVAQHLGHLVLSLLVVAMAEEEARHSEEVALQADHQRVHVVSRHFKTSDGWHHHLGRQTKV